MRQHAVDGALRLPVDAVRDQRINDHAARRAAQSDDRQRADARRRRQCDDGFIGHGAGG
jgi:hypothetical protein